MEGVSKEQVKDYIKNMTLMDAAALVKELEEELGVSAAAPVAVAAAGPAAAAAEEKTEFNVILAEAGEKKIQVIKVVREITGSRLEGSQGSRRWRAQAGERSGAQGGSRDDQEEARRAGRQGRNQVSLSRWCFPLNFR